MTDLAKLARWHEGESLRRRRLGIDGKLHTDAAATTRAAMAEIERLRKAATELMAGSDIVMEDILWGDLPDSATGTMTMRLGAYRKVRAAFKETAHD